MARQFYLLLALIGGFILLAGLVRAVSPPSVASTTRALQPAATPDDGETDTPAEATETPEAATPADAATPEAQAPAMHAEEDETCHLPEPAFCETFAQAHPGGRGGDLDEELWSYVRVNGVSTTVNGGVNEWRPTTVAFCRDTRQGVLPPADSFMCGPQYDESNHWMEAFDDGGGHVFDSARIRQPFDFAGRTGTISYDVDATATGHGWWHQIAISDEPIPGPYQDVGVIRAPMRNGVLIVWAHCLDNSDQGDTNAGQVGEIHVFRNYRDEYHGPQTLSASCIATEPDMPNHIEIKISQQQIQVWASDKSPDHVTMPNFHLIASVSGLNLPLTRGYVHFQHGQYNAAKGTEAHGRIAYHTFHWDNIGFDGPVLPTPRGYDVPDSMMAHGRAMNLGYLVDGNGIRRPDGQVVTGGFSLAGVNLKGATYASINLDVQQGWHNHAIDYRLNGGAWRTYAYPYDDNWAAWRAFSIPVPLADLRAGTNTLELRVTDEPQGVVIANIDLTVDNADNLLTPTPAPRSTPSSGAAGHQHDATSTPQATPAPAESGQHHH